MFSSRKVLQLGGHFYFPPIPIIIAIAVFLTFTRCSAPQSGGLKMDCIRCHQPLTLEQYEEVEIDRCGKCQGVWLDAKELAKIVGSAIETFPDSLVTKTLEAKFGGVPKQELDSVELCPKCSTEMKPINYSYESGIIIDSCPKGHGIWLDLHELEKVQIFKENEDKKLKENRSEWHKIATDTKQKVKSELKQPSTGGGISLIGGLSQIIRNWLL